jgi:hypothetical protein
MQHAECKMQKMARASLNSAFYILPFAFLRGLPGFHRADPSTPLDEQSSVVGGQYSMV